LEWTIEGICNCSPQDPLEVQALQGLPEGYDPRITVDVNSLLVEGKGVGKVATDITRDVVLSHATTRGASFHKDKSKARSAARKQLERVLQDTHVRLIALVDRFKKKKKYVRFDAFKKEFKSILKASYYKAYELGLKSTGSATFLTAGGSKLVTPSDRKWVEAAFLQEMKYLNRLLTDIKLNRTPGRWPHRIGMYVATVGSIYYTGRVAVTPPNHALFWIAKIDSRLCPQCRYMATHSPFTKYNIPITPASGHTKCLSNCRCAIAVRPVSKAVFTRLRKDVSRATHLRRLKAALS
jgi:hypothetical protein